MTTALLVAAPRALAAQAKPDWTAFDKYVAKAAADWRIHALAIAVVKDDSVVFAKGYGVLQKGTSQPANEHTRIAIGSTTKAMTSASIAMLVDEGKLKLDDPVTKYIPELQLSDPWVTRDTGSINGLCAIIGIEPNKRLGVYVLENLDHAEIRHGLMYTAFDLFENGPRRDWSADLKPIFARQPNAAQSARATSPPSLSLERYAGTYVDSAYGNVNVTFENGALQAAVVTDAAVPLEPVSFETFRTKPSDGGRPTVLTFVSDGSGGVSGVRVANIVFVRSRVQP